MSSNYRPGGGKEDRDRADTSGSIFHLDRDGPLNRRQSTLLFNHCVDVTVKTLMEGMYSAIVENFDGSVSHRTDEESVVIIKRALKQYTAKAIQSARQSMESLLPEAYESSLSFYPMEEEEEGGSEDRGGYRASQSHDRKSSSPSLDDNIYSDEALDNNEEILEVRTLNVSTRKGRASSEDGDGVVLGDNDGEEILLEYDITFTEGAIGLRVGGSGDQFDSAIVSGVSSDQHFPSTKDSRKIDLGDQIVSINGTPVANISYQEVSQAIRVASRPLVIRFRKKKRSRSLGDLREKAHTGRFPEGLSSKRILRSASIDLDANDASTKSINSFKIMGKGDRDRYFMDVSDVRWNVGVKGHVERSGYVAYEVLSQGINFNDAIKDGNFDIELCWTSSTALVHSATVVDARSAPAEIAGRIKLSIPLVVERRYRYFKWLRDKLKSDPDVPKTILIPRLPPKKAMSMGSKYSGSLVYTRQVLLNQWMRFICSHPILRRNRHLIAFLREPEMKDVKSVSTYDPYVGKLNVKSPSGGAGDNSDDADSVGSEPSKDDLMTTTVSPTLQQTVSAGDALSRKDLLKRSKERLFKCERMVPLLDKTAAEAEKISDGLVDSSATLELLGASVAAEFQFSFSPAVNKADSDYPFISQGSKCGKVIDTLRRGEKDFTDRSAKAFATLGSAMAFISSEILPATDRLLKRYSNRKTYDDALHVEWEYIKPAVNGQIAAELHSLVTHQVQAQSDLRRVYEGIAKSIETWDMASLNSMVAHASSVGFDDSVSRRGSLSRQRSYSDNTLDREISIIDAPVTKSSEGNNSSNSVPSRGPSRSAASNPLKSGDGSDAKDRTLSKNVRSEGDKGAGEDRDKARKRTNPAVPDMTASLHVDTASNKLYEYTYGRDKISSSPILASDGTTNESDAELQAEILLHVRQLRALREKVGSVGMTRKQGYLLKRSKTSRHWLKRYFVLDSCAVSYFVEARDPTPKGEMFLEPNAKISILTEKPFTFMVTSGAHVLVTTAANQADMDSWVDAVYTVISELKTVQKRRLSHEKKPGGSGMGRKISSNTSGGVAPPLVSSSSSTSNSTPTRSQSPSAPPTKSDVEGVPESSLPPKHNSLGKKSSQLNVKSTTSSDPVSEISSRSLHSTDANTGVEVHMRHKISVIDPTGGSKAFDEEISNWIEARTEEGVPYFYHKTTRAVRWEKPEGPMAAEIEARIEESEREVRRNQEKRIREIKQLEEAKAKTAVEETKATNDAYELVLLWQKNAGGNSKNGDGADVKKLISTIHSILPERFPEAFALGPAASQADVKKSYLKIIRLVHPDKIESGVSLTTKILCEKVFSSLTTAYDKYRDGV